MYQSDVEGYSTARKKVVHKGQVPRADLGDS